MMLSYSTINTSRNNMNILPSKSVFVLIQLLLDVSINVSTVLFPSSIK